MLRKISSRKKKKLRIRLHLVSRLDKSRSTGLQYRIMLRRTISRQRQRRFVYSALLGTTIVGGIEYDRRICYARATRNLRSFYAAIWTLYEYKINWHRAKTPLEKSQVHDRVAKRWYDVCCKNGGLYIKLGQSVTTLNHVLPPEYLKYFQHLHDQAPQADYEEVRRIFREDLGVDIEDDERFQSFEPIALASASIAQVHKAVLRNGDVVAVKVQKPWIRKQLPFDLGCYRILVYALEKAFDLPMYWTTGTVCSVISNEADFVVEAANAKRAANEWNKSEEWRGKVYVPKVYDHLTTGRVLTQEWIDGIKINELGALESAGFRRREVAQRMIGMFADQIFATGFIHGDPHPGNLLVRREPSSGDMQMVCLDHGMYQEFSATFRRAYSELWVAICTGDSETMERICDEWAVGDSELFATLQMLKPYNAKKSSQHTKSTSRADILAHTLEMRQHGFERVRKMLKDTSQVPQEFVFLGRQMNIVRANNAAMGSPANRTRILANHAAKQVAQWNGLFSYVLFSVRMFLLDVAFGFVQWRRRMSQWIGLESDNFEQILEQRLADALAEKTGIILNIRPGETWEDVCGA